MRPESGHVFTAHQVYLIDCRICGTRLLWQESPEAEESLCALCCATRYWVVPEKSQTEKIFRFRMRRLAWPEGRWGWLEKREMLDPNMSPVFRGGWFRWLHKAL
jgi:hypothetical protein